LAIRAITAVMPVTFLISSSGGMAIGIEGSSSISRALGSGNTARASRTFGNQVPMTLALGFVLDVEVLLLFDAAGEVLPVALGYYHIQWQSAEQAHDAHEPLAQSAGMGDEQRPHDRRPPFVAEKVGLEVNGFAVRRACACFVVGCIPDYGTAAAGLNDCLLIKDGPVNGTSATVSRLTSDS
jgi:hypothetical protein